MALKRRQETAVLVEGRTRLRRRIEAVRPLCTPGPTPSPTNVTKVVRTEVEVGLSPPSTPRDSKNGCRLSFSSIVPFNDATSPLPDIPAPNQLSFFSIMPFNDATAMDYNPSASSPLSDISAPIGPAFEACLLPSDHYLFRKIYPDGRVRPAFEASFEHDLFRSEELPFKGRRVGCVFNENGLHGPGYYRDEENFPNVGSVDRDEENFSDVSSVDDVVDGYLAYVDNDGESRDSRGWHYDCGVWDFPLVQVKTDSESKWLEDEDCWVYDNEDEEMELTRAYLKDVFENADEQEKCDGPLYWDSCWDGLVGHEEDPEGDDVGDDEDDEADDDHIGVSYDHVCGDCCYGCDRLVILLRPAENTQLQLSRLKRKHKYHHPKLRNLLKMHAFDIHGGYLYHHDCLKRLLKVSTNFLVRTRKFARNGELLSRSKEFVISQQLTDRVLVPIEYLGTPREYLATLGDSDLVTITPSYEDSPHGLSARIAEESNRYNSACRRLLRKFVQENRSPTGRTEDETGRPHGAVFYLDSRFLQLQFYEECESRKFRHNRDDKHIFTSSFRNELLRLNEEIELNPGDEDQGPVTLVLPSHRTIAGWFKLDFSSTSVKFPDGTDSGYTTIHPQKSDACSSCCSFQTDINSVSMCLSRHRQHNEKPAVIAQLTTQLAKLNEKLANHRLAASTAKTTYRSISGEAYDKYQSVFLFWEELRRNYDDSEEARKLLTKFISIAAHLLFVIEHDYQENKKIPSWGASPQPGPVYFLSSRVFFVHVIVSPSLGTPEGDSKFGRNVVYTRDEVITTRGVKVGKYSDDTLSTVFHFLSGNSETGYSPSEYRTGYDANGRL